MPFRCLSDPCAIVDSNGSWRRTLNKKYLHNLLDDPLFDVVVNGTLGRLTLPDVVARLLDARLTELRGVSAIQRQFVWRLLVRCAAFAARGGSPDALTADVVRDRLAEATPDREAWSLYRADGGAAFLQVPVATDSPEASGYKLEDLSRLTVIPGGKNHEFKRGVAARLSPSDALYALVEYQFGSIFTKANYASQIMGSATGKGSGSPFMAPWWPSLGASFRAHVSASLEHSAYVRDVLGLTGDVWALWTLPWMGQKDGMPGVRLAPNFIPVARRVRLDAPSSAGQFERLWFSSSKGPRVADHTMGSGLGDPFTPFVVRDAHVKVRGVMGTGFDYREVARLLLGAPIEPRGSNSFAVAYAARASIEEILPVLMEGVAFDQGKTIGFHQRFMELPRLSVLDPEPHALLLDAMLTDAKSSESALTAAARVWMSGSAKPKKGDRSRVDHCRSFLTNRIDKLFFTEIASLMRNATELGTIDDAQGQWRSSLETAARSALDEVMASTPVPIARRFARAADAEDALRRGFLRHGWPTSHSQRLADGLSAQLEPENG